MSINEAAVTLNVSSQQVVGWLRSGKLNGTRDYGTKQWDVSRKDVEKVLNGQKRLN